MSNNNKLGRSILINCIHYYLFKKVDHEKKIGRKDLESWLGIGFHIPQEKQKSVTKELELIGIVKRINRDMFEVKPCKIFV